MPAAVPRPRTSLPRPPLPIDNANPHLDSIDPLRPPPVKFQEIVRDGQATIVGRVKIPTPGGGHAFILRRLDTGAISLTTMFRASFPAASEEAEKSESAWVKNNFDLTGTNKSGKSRFAGTWVSPETAKFLADSYHLGPVIEVLAVASPDPDVVYRKSSRNQQTPTASPAAAPGLHSHAPQQTVATTAAETPTPPAAKRRREEASPSQIPVRSTAPVSSHRPPPDLPSWTPLTPASSTIAASSTTTVVTITRAPPASPAPTRRSARLRSPGPTPGPAAPKTPRSARAAARSRERDQETPAGSDETAVEHEYEDSAEVAKVAGIDMAEDVREQKELIERLKAERAQKEKEKADEMDDDEDDEDDTHAKKRGREEANSPYKLNIREPGPVEERQIATNRRIVNMTPARKSLAWGALLFAVGMGAAYLPTIAPGLSELSGLSGLTGFF